MGQRAMTKRDDDRKSITALRNFSAGLILLAEVSPRNLTMSQLTFFLTAAMADIGGRPATFSELKEAVGPAVGRSLHTTYKIFLKEGRMRDGVRMEGVGWLKTDVDPLDNRRKPMSLTRSGKRIVDELLATLALGETR